MMGRVLQSGDAVSVTLKTVLKLKKKLTMWNYCTYTIDVTCSLKCWKKSITIHSVKTEQYHYFSETHHENQTNYIKF